MDDLIAFWRDRLDELERIAKAARDASEWPEIMGGARSSLRNWYGDKLPAATVAHIAASDPASVLADIAADRAILARYEALTHPTILIDRAIFPALAEVVGACIRDRVAKFASHPGYKEAWKP